MARPVLMPQVGQDLTEGKLTALNVKVGDKIKKGDIVAEVESEKAVFEVEAFETGTVLEVRYQVGDMATVLEPLMMVGEEGEVLESAAATATVFVGKEAAAIVAVSESPAATVTSAVSKNESRGSSPLARRLAASGGIDIGLVTGSGPHGAVVKRDIEAFQQLGPIQARNASIVSGRTSTAGRAALPLKTLQQGRGDAVILIHGFGAELSAWRAFVSQLGLPNPVMALDLPAHGAAAGVTAHDFEELTDAVHSSLTDAGLGRVHLVGHSLGAAVAASIAGSGDINVLSLSLLAPAGLGPKINGDYVAGFLSSSSEASLKMWLEQLVSNPASLPGVLVRATLSSREGTPMIANQTALASGVFAGHTQLFSIRDALARYSGPTRVIVGREDRIIPAEHSDAVPAHVGLYRLPHVGHLPQLEASALTGRLIAENVRSAG